MMLIEIKEVWNYDGKSEVIGKIESNPHEARRNVVAWIEANRPDLSLADTMSAHGYTAKCIAEK